MNTDEINRLFEEAASEDRKIKGATPPRKPRNPVFAANRQLQEIAEEKKSDKRGFRTLGQKLWME